MAIELYEAVLNEEFNDFIEGYNEEEVDLEIINNKGDVVIPLNKSYNDLKNILNEVFNDIGDEQLTIRGGNHDNFIYYGDFFEYYIDDKVKKLRDVTFEEGLLLALQLKNEDPKFAGCIFIGNNESGDDLIINPLHPAIAQYIMNSDENFEEYMSKTGTFMYFNFKKDKILNEDRMNKAREIHDVGMLLFTENFMESAKSEVQVRNRTENFSDIFAIADINASIEIDIRSSIPSALIPFQILSRGELVPYFGWGLINTNGDEETRGFSFPGLLSGNIKSNYYSSSDQVCTGNKSNNAYNGWQTLSKVNVNSMWFNHVINEDYYYELYRTGMDVAEEIYNEEYMIDEDGENEEQEISQGISQENINENIVDGACDACEE